MGSYIGDAEREPFKVISLRFNQNLPQGENTTEHRKQTEYDRGIEKRREEKRREEKRREEKRREEKRREEKRREENRRV
jgi:hypothetical protein